MHVLFRDAYGSPVRLYAVSEPHVRFHVREFARSKGLTNVTTEAAAVAYLRSHGWTIAIEPGSLVDLSL